MANKGSSDLFKLIKELSAHEKAYFKKYARQHASDDTDYLKLFEAIDDMEAYDDQLLRGQFNNLSYLKNYLFNLLLQTLVSYNNNPEQVGVYLTNKFLQAEMLEKKGFTRNAIKEMSAGMELAAKSNQSILQYNFASAYYRLKGIIMPVNERKKFLDESYAALNELLQHEIQQLRYKHEFSKLLLLATQRSQGSSQPSIENEIDFKLLANPPAKQGVAERRSYHQAMIAYYLSHAEFNKAYEQAQLYIKDEKARLREAGNDFTYYSEALAFCSAACTELKKYKEAEKCLEELRKIKSPNERVNAYNLSRYVAYSLITYCSSQQYAKGATFALQAFEKYPQLYNNVKLDVLYTPLVCYSAFILFMNRNYKECIDLLNDVNMVHIRKNALYSYKDIEMMRLMLQTEMGNHQLLNNLVRTISTKLKKYKLEDEYVRTLFNFFKQVPKGITESQRISTVTTLQRQTSQKGDHAPFLLMGVMYYHDWIKGVRL